LYKNLGEKGSFLGNFNEVGVENNWKMC